MSRFDARKATSDDESLTELERQQKEMLKKIRFTEPTPIQPIIDETQFFTEEEQITFIKENEIDRITLRLQHKVHESMRILAKFSDESLNSIISKACVEYISKERNQELIKKYNKFK